MFFADRLSSTEWSGAYEAMPWSDIPAMGGLSAVKASSVYLLSVGQYAWQHK
jgi:hypothetical protein